MPRACALSRWLPLALAAMLAACAGERTQLAVGADEASMGHYPGDPYEADNRAALARNLALYDAVIEPAIRAYRWVLPDALRDGISNLFDNLATPRILVNDLLQAEWERAAATFGRFAINTTIGFGGLFDRAAQMGIERHDEDFGQTLAVYGAEGAPYLVVPLLGPSNPRDLAGRVVDTALDPVNYLLFPVVLGANFTSSTFDRLARDPDRLAALRRNSIDFYATLRSAYAQMRAHEIGNGGAGGAGFEELDDPDEQHAGQGRPGS